MYASPPTGDDVDRTGETREKATEKQADDATAPDDASVAETESRTAAPELEPTTSTTDANWTGTVPADD